MGNYPTDGVKIYLVDAFAIWLQTKGYSFIHCIYEGSGTLKYVRCVGRRLSVSLNENCQPFEVGSVCRFNT